MVTHIEQLGEYASSCHFVGEPSTFTSHHAGVSKERTASSSRNAILLKLRPMVSEREVLVNIYRSVHIQNLSWRLTSEAIGEIGILDGVPGLRIIIVNSTLSSAPPMRLLLSNYTWYLINDSLLWNCYVAKVASMSLFSQYELDKTVGTFNNVGVSQP